MRGKRVFGVTTAGKFFARYGLVPVIVPGGDVEAALQTGELDGVAWCGFIEAYEVGWADVCGYAPTNNVTSAWCSSYFANTASWEKVPPYLEALFKATIDQSHYCRQVWYWSGEAELRAKGNKVELTMIPSEEWETVERNAAEFWTGIASTSDRAARAVQTFKDY